MAFTAADKHRAKPHASGESSPAECNNLQDSLTATTVKAILQ
jgi:hypothetical protein